MAKTKKTLSPVEDLNLKHNRRWFRKMGLIHLWMPPTIVCKAEKLDGKSLEKDIRAGTFRADVK